MIEHAVILAISSSRHRSRLTYDRAHAMLPALGKPLVVRIMERLYRLGIRNYTVVVGENEGAVASYITKSWMPDITIELVIKFDSDNILKVLRNIARKRQEPFLISGYNCFTHPNFPESLSKQHTATPDALILSATSKSLSHSNRHYYAVMDGRNIVQLTEFPRRDQYTMTLCDFAVVGQTMVDQLTKDNTQPKGVQASWQFLDVAQHYLNQGGQSFVAETAWTLQIETDRDLLTLNKQLLNEGQDAHILSEIPYTVQIIPPIRIDPQVNVGQGAKIGPHVYLERGCSVGHGVTLRDTVVLARASIPANKSASGTIIGPRGPIS